MFATPVASRTLKGSSNGTERAFRHSPYRNVRGEAGIADKTVLEESEIDDPEARGAVSHHAISRLHTSITPDNQRLLKSEVGARAIMDLSRWYEEQRQPA